MATNMCKILQTVKDIEGQTPLNLGDMPVGDLFKMSSLSAEEYELLGNKNKLYSSEYLKNIKQQLAANKHKL